MIDRLKQILLVYRTEDISKLTFEERMEYDNTFAEEIVKLFPIHNVSGSLPSLDDATKVAVRISEEAIKPPLDVKEQAMFIAGFQECIKWLNVVFGNDC